MDPSGPGPGSLDAFVRACRGEPFYCGAGATEGLKTVATIDALYRSLRSGRPEKVSGCDGL
jgi:predicted dehydrogenase